MNSTWVNTSFIKYPTKYCVAAHDLVFFYGVKLLALMISNKRMMIKINLIRRYSLISQYREIYITVKLSIQASQVDGIN